MSLQACAELVERGDPDRFLAAMAAPPAARAVLFPVYAFNIEVTRAPWVTAEPMLAEMRLQWWRDALEEIGAGGVVRRHEVTLPLAHALDAGGAALLDALIEARRQDIEGAPFDGPEALRDYLDATAAGLSWTTARALGAAPGDEVAVRAWGQAAGLARWFQALPELAARGRRPMWDEGPEVLRALAREALDGLAGVRLRGPARAAVLECWRARPLLRQVLRDPAAVPEGRLAQSEAARRLGLMRFAVLGR